MSAPSSFDFFWFQILVVVWLFKYVRTVVGIIAWNCFKAIPYRGIYTTDDVTVIVPTIFKTPDELVKCLKSITSCIPAATFVVTSNTKVAAIKELVDANHLKNIEVLGVDKFNKREQMAKALRRVETRFTVFADDDVIWPNDRYLNYLLACFESSPEIGACGSRQSVQVRSGNLWNILGCAYLERRNFNNLTTIAIDGSISTLSGRTSAYRTQILKNEAFYYAFLNQTFRNGNKLNSDDDKFLTRWVYSHGHLITIQADESAILETTLEESSLYLEQCGRWARARFRGNFAVMEKETYWRSLKYWWGCYAIYANQFLLSSAIYEVILFLLLHLAVIGSSTRTWAFLMLATWIMFTKNVKMMSHFRRRPQDLKFVPALMAFSYFHGYINIRALLTLQDTAWSGKNLKALEDAPAMPSTTDETPLLTNLANATEEKQDVTYVIPTKVLTPKLTADNGAQSGKIVGGIAGLLFPEYITVALAT